VGQSNNCCADMPSIIDHIHDLIEKQKYQIDQQQQQIEQHQKQNDQMQKQIDNLQSQVNQKTAEMFDCADVLKANSAAKSGVFTVQVKGSPVKVYCDMDTNGGGWTVVQRRRDGSENFFRNWSDYATGFGTLTGEFWLGNDNLAAILGRKSSQTLRFELENWNGEKRYAEYNDFRISGAETNYKLESLGVYSGNAGNSMAPGDSQSNLVGQAFTTIDRDNDKWASDNCSKMYKGAWWYNACHKVNLNGEYKNTASGQGVNWVDFAGATVSLKFTEMKFRSRA